MIDGQEENRGGGMAVSRDEFFTTLENLEKNMAACTAKLIKPIASHIVEFRSALDKVSQTAEAAMEMSLTIQEETKYLLQREDWATDKILSLDNQMRAHNVKFSRFPEKSEENTDLTSFIASWLASALQLENGVAPLLDLAYRLGQSGSSHRRAWPRDIDEENSKAHHFYSEGGQDQISVGGILQVVHQDHILHDSDIETGLTLLKVLQLKTLENTPGEEDALDKPGGNLKWQRKGRRRF
ncbi:UNVERIFIED_CONTAM: hypothetical protein K2H54_054433 [Gekko kuhli]